MKKKMLTLILPLVTLIIVFFVAFSFQFLNSVQINLYANAQNNIYKQSENTANYFRNIIQTEYQEFEEEIRDFTYDDVVTNYSEYIKNIYENYPSDNRSLLLSVGFIDSSASEKHDVHQYFVSEDSIENYEDLILDYKTVDQYGSIDRYFNQKISIIEVNNFFTDSNLTQQYAILFLRGFSDGTSTVYLYELLSFNNFYQIFVDNFTGDDVSFQYYFIASGDGYVYNSNYSGKTLFREIFGGENSDLEIFSDDKVNQTTLTLNDKKTFVTRSLIFNVSFDESSSRELCLFYAIDATAVHNEYSALYYNAIVYGLELLLAMILVTVIFTFVSWNSFQNYKLTLFEFNFAKTYTIVVDGKGNIIRRNGLFKSIDKEKRKNLTEYGIMDDEQRINEVLKKASFVIKVSNLQKHPASDEPVKVDKYIRFTNIRHRNRFQLIGNNITEEFLKQEKLVYLSYYNPVCNILNRRALEDDLASHISKIQQSENKSMLLLDILEFRNINGLFGYEFGNEVLRHATEQIKTALGTDDVLYSLEADKFAVLVSKPEERGGINKICDIFFDLFREPIDLSSNSIVLVICIGVYNLDKNKEGFMTPKSIIDGAILANKHAKGVANKRLYIYDLSLSKNVEKETIMQEDLKQALFKNEFTLHYQPQYDLLEKKVIGFESLLRWDNPKYRLESPFKYIKIAERTGLINDIGQFVLVESFKLAQQLGADSKIHISVNVSPAQLLQTGFLAKFVSLYEEYKVPFDAIAIEITETFLMTSFQECISRLKFIREKGIKVYIDDFGTGYSSLLYLSELPIDFIKIDREFIKDLQTSKSSRIIVSKLIALANELGIKVVAEGVESAYQAKFLVKNNCSYIQGWLISKAVKKEEVPKVLKINVDYSEK